MGAFCVRALAAAGVDVSLVQADAALQTGITASFSAEDRALVTYPGAIAQLTAAEIPAETLAQFQHLHVSSYYLQSGLQSGLAGLFERAKAMGLTVSLDPGYDPAGEWSQGILAVLRYCDVFLLNELELAGLAGTPDVVAGLRALGGGARLTVVKLGARGCAAWWDGQLYEASAITVDVVDTTGAGDSFNAGFLRSWLRQEPLEQCLACGSICGGLSTRRLGGCGGQADWQEVEGWLERTLRGRASYATMSNRE
jgi:sugar/nucleoside kinase (ribokinase family)